MTIDLLGDRILVEPLQREEKTTESGITLVENYQPPDTLGTVVAVGADVIEDAIQPGVVVLFPEWAGQEVWLGKGSLDLKKYIIIREADASATVELN